MRASIFVVTLLLIQGCVDSTILHYETLTRNLDGRNELRISTYPSGYPVETFSVPFVYKAQRTPDTVYFQFFIRAAGKNGPNPHIEEVLVHSFSYHFPGQQPVMFLRDYSDNFWMQGDPAYAEVITQPVRHSEGWYLNLDVDVTVNGERYQISEQVHATARRSLRPLIYEVFR